MGSSAVSVGESMFWTNDHFLQVWLGLLANEVTDADQPMDELHAMADDWRIMACHDFTGLVNHSVPDDLSPKAHEALLNLCRKVLAKLDQRDTDQLDDILDCSEFENPHWQALETIMTPRQVWDIGSAFIDIFSGELRSARPGTQWFVGYRGGRTERLMQASTARKMLLKALDDEFGSSVPPLLRAEGFEEWNSASELAAQELDPSQPINVVVNSLANSNAPLNESVLCMLEDLCQVTDGVDLQPLDEAWRHVAANTRGIADLQLLTHLRDELARLETDESADGRTFQRLLETTSHAAQAPLYKRYFARMSASLSWSYEGGSRVPAATRDEILAKMTMLKSRV